MNLWFFFWDFPSWVLNSFLCFKKEISLKNHLAERFAFKNLEWRPWGSWIIWFRSTFCFVCLRIVDAASSEIWNRWFGCGVQEEETNIQRHDFSLTRLISWTNVMQSDAERFVLFHSRFYHACIFMHKFFLPISFFCYFDDHDQGR